jgi:microcystin degradation protein MlrC
MPSGIVEHAVFEAFWNDLERTVKGASPLSAIYVVLHGAMVTQEMDDVEGELLVRLRELEGVEDLPIFGVFDLHASFTARMAGNANGLVAYRENPHTDARESATRAAHLLERGLRTGERPRMVVDAPGILWPPSGTGTAMRPMAELCRLARAAEQRYPELYAVNVAAGFAYADAREAGVSISVSGTNVEHARAVAREIAQAAWDMRNQGLVLCQPVERALERLSPQLGKSLILVEPSDNIGGGAPGDGTGILRALLAHGIERGLVVINDPETVAAISDLEPGEMRRLRIGGKSGGFDAGPVELEVELLGRSDGRFELEDPHSHLASISGTRIDMGPCATVRHAGITVLLTSRRTPPFDLGQLRSQGLEPTGFKVIGVKAAVAHKRAYDPITGLSIDVETLGACTNRLDQLPYRRLARPIFPLDEMNTPRFADA